MIAPSLRGRETRIAIALSAAVAIVGSALAQQSTESAPGTPQIFEVQRGDTFSGIAARVTGNVATWRKLYDPQRTGIVDPSLIFPGMRLELIRQAEIGRAHV